MNSGIEELKPRPVTYEQIPLNDLKRDTASNNELSDTVARVLSSGWFILGPETEALERDLEERFNAFAVAVASGTDALMLAGRALGLTGNSTQVASAANAGGYGAISIVENDAIPVPLDVDPDTLLVGVTELAAAWSADMRGVIVPHLFGNVAPIEEIADFARSKGAKVIEDCAQAFGATVENQPVGTFGDAGTLSFFPTKNLGALGDGGAVITSSRATADLVRSLRQYGWDQKYQVRNVGGVNSRLDEIQAAILRLRLGEVDANNDHRRRIVSRYRDATTTSAGIRWITRSSTGNVAHLAVLRSTERSKLASHFSDLGIQTDIHYPVVDNENGTLAHRCATVTCPNAEAASLEILTIPCFPTMTESEIDRVCRALATFAIEQSTT